MGVEFTGGGRNGGRRAEGVSGSEFRRVKIAIRAAVCEAHLENPVVGQFPISGTRTALRRNFFRGTFDISTQHSQRMFVSFTYPR